MANLSNDHQTFIRVLDGVPIGLAFYDARGELVHRNRTLRRILDENKSEPAVQNEIESVVREFCSQLAEDQDHDSSRGHVFDDIATRELRLAEKCYRLRVGFTGMELFGHGSSVIVTLDDDPGSAVVSDDQLREQFGLTGREIRVARLISTGCSNADIAQRLYISPHTVRRHTEKILRKLNVSTRAHVASAMLGRARTGMTASSALLRRQG
jgi:DNA-binding CsgD family transcriptional regulator